MKEKYPLKGEPEINRMFEEIQSDKVYIDSQYWLKIIERMYEDSDAEILEQKIKESARIRI